MIKADLHCHSTYSREPSEWFLQQLGAKESYTDVEELYRQAKARGMTYVTVTDHDSIEGAEQLVARHPEDCFLSAEITATFPEDGCKVHILVYGLDAARFTHIQTIRHNIHDLRDYLRAEGLACAVAHPTYPVNGKLTVETLEKLLLLFDVFEGMNGARGRFNNRAWVAALHSLDAAAIARLRARHGIEPWGPTPWIKGFTGGSDDHSGLLIGATFTMTEDATIPEFLAQVRQGAIHPGGLSGDYRSLAFAVYKGVYDHARQRTPGRIHPTWSALHALLFENGRMGLKHWLVMQHMKRRKASRDRIMGRFLEDLADRDPRAQGPDAMIDRVYHSLSRLSDDCLSMLASSLETDLARGQADRLLHNLSAALPAILLATPFVSTMRHMHQDRPLVRQLHERIAGPRTAVPKRILWFTDTLTDLNGVAVTLREVAHCAHATGRPVQVITSLPEDQCPPDLPPTVLNLPCIYALTPEFYTAFTLRVPSLLRSLERIAQQEPDEIVISTPGPVGLLGLAAARLLDVPCVGIYHTDFTRQVEHFIGDPRAAALVEAYTRWFFRAMDAIRVPTRQYIDLLTARGLPADRMTLFRRTIDPLFAVEDERRQEALRDRLRLPDGITLLWTGRMGKEKNLDFLYTVYREVVAREPNVNLLIVGDGPEWDAFRTRARGNPRLVLAGRVARAELPHFYALADVFVFPSTTDTFGMVVLEAQACGLPAVVTDVGGPQEIVRHGETGYVLPAGDRQAWVQTVLNVIDRRLLRPSAYAAWRDAIRARARASAGWEAVLDQMTGAGNPPPSPPIPATSPCPPPAFSPPVVAV